MLMQEQDDNRKQVKIVSMDDLIPNDHLLRIIDKATVAEKIDAILSLMEFSSRMKDYYDIYYLSHKFDFSGNVLCEALSKSFANRGHNFTIGPLENNTQSQNVIMS